MAAPPSLAGAFQKRLTCVGETATAVSPVGEPGTVAIANTDILAVKISINVIVDERIVFSKYELFENFTWDCAHWCF
jgi:hypothetical protein